MPINTLGLALGLTEARNQGLEQGDALPVAVVASLVGSPVVSLFAARALASRKVQELAPVVPTPSPEPDGRPPTGSPDEPADTQAQIDRAAADAKEAKQTAREAKREAQRTAKSVERLTEKVRELSRRAPAARKVGGGGSAAQSEPQEAT